MENGMVVELIVQHNVILVHVAIALQEIAQTQLVQTVLLIFILEFTVAN
jgi:hypothetical protein